MLEKLSGRPVVVGVDGSASALDATAYAAAEAARQRRSLLIVTALDFPLIDAPVDPKYLGQVELDLRAQADRYLDAAATTARATAPGVEINTRLVIGSPAAALVAATRGASVVVLGSRGCGAFTDLIAGSVAVQVATHADGPVVVVRGHADPHADVVLGADGSEHSAAAAGYAFEEAARCGTGVTAVRAGRRPTAAGPLATDEARAEAAEVQGLADALAPWRSKFPEVPVRLRPVRAGATAALVDASRAARLVVVGARGHGGFTGLLLGSVGQALIHHAHCPVAIVRPARGDR